MRETLHQLALALALPITVGAFWIARADRAEPVVRERATAYRVELAQLPLPNRERLRSPGLPTGTSTLRQEPEEEAAPRERRPALPEPAETGAGPLDLLPRGDSAPVVAAAPSPRPSLETLGAAPRNAPSVAAPVAMAPPSLSSRRAEASGQKPASAPGTQPSPTQSLPGRSTPSAPTPIAKSPQKAVPASDGEPGVRRRTRELAPQNPPVSDTSFGRRRGNNPDHAPNRPILIASLPRHSDPAPSNQPTRPDGSPPLIPPGKIEASNDDLSPLPSSPSAEPKLPPVELPPQASPIARNAIPMDFGPDEESFSPQTLFAWGNRPTFMPIPEPGSAILLGAALAALGALRRSRRRA